MITLLAIFTTCFAHYDEIKKKGDSTITKNPKYLLEIIGFTMIFEFLIMFFKTIWRGARLLLKK